MNLRSEYVHVAALIKFHDTSRLVSCEEQYCSKINHVVMNWKLYTIAHQW
jgi:hypothetical protein